MMVQDIQFQAIFLTIFFNFDACSGCCNSPAMTDQIFGSYALLPLQLVTASYVPSNGLNFTEQNTAPFLVSDGDVVGSSNSSEDDVMFQLPNIQVGFSMDSADGYDSFSHKRISDIENHVIPSPHVKKLNEKMLKALSLLKESSEGGIFAQVWVPIKHGDRYILCTCEQPYLLDQNHQMLVPYREVSRAYTFSAEAKPGCFHVLPGCVLI